MFEVEYLWHGWVKQDVVNTDISNTFDLSLDSPSESASVLFQKRYGFYNVTFRYNALIPKKRRVIPRGGVHEDVLGLEDVLEDTF